MTVESLIERHRTVPLPPPAERRRRREAFGISLVALGGEVGVTAAAMSRYETGKREPRGEVRERYAEVLASLARHEVSSDAG